MRRVREPHRAQAEQARRRRGVRQLRDRAGGRALRPGSRDVRRSHRRGRVRGLPRRARRRGQRAADRADAVRRRLVVAAALHVPLARSRWSRRSSSTAGSGWRSRSRPRRALGRLRLPPRRAPQRPPRRATMDTLISIGTLAAWGWSVVALAPRRRRRRLLRGRRRHHDADPARPLPRGPRAERRSSAAIRALLELGAKEARVLRDGVEVSVPVEEVAAATSSSCGRERRSRPTASSSRATRRSTSRCSPASPSPSTSSPGERRGGDDQHLRSAGRARDEGRRRDGARADRAPRRRGAVREGADPAARRPRLGRLRPGRARDRARDARRLAAREG